MSPADPADPADSDVLLRAVRMIDLTNPGHQPDPTDVRITAGIITEIGADLPAHPREATIHADGRWAMPGLWDQHVHLDQWSLTAQRLDLSGTGSAGEVCAILADHLARTPGSNTIQGFGHRTATWPRQPTVTELDAVTGDRPVVLISGDAHHGWLNTAALRTLGLPLRDTVVEEAEWFDAYPRLSELTSTQPTQDDSAKDNAVRDVLTAAARLGVTGIVDLEFAANQLTWPERCAADTPAMRVRAGFYPDQLDAVLASGLRTGDPLPGCGGLVRLGPLKIISDGSLSTRTAYCCQPYADAVSLPYPHGIQNVPPDELSELLTRAHRGGLQVAVHAIGDAAVSDALDAFATTNVSGSIEHAQLITDSDVPRLAALGITASMQPAHLLDDHEVIDQCWPDRARRCFRIRTMLAAGVTVQFGSDAPVSPLDPWLAVSAAVHRGSPGQPPWQAQEAITRMQALACSTDGVTRLMAGGPGDVVLVDRNPLSPATDLRQPGVAATVVAGRIVHADISLRAPLD